jgi:hypothetical protein
MPNQTFTPSISPSNTPSTLARYIGNEQSLADLTPKEDIPMKEKLIFSLLVLGVALTGIAAATLDPDKDSPRPGFLYKH